LFEVHSNITAHTIQVSAFVSFSQHAPLPVHSLSQELLAQSLAPAPALMSPTSLAVAHGVIMQASHSACDLWCCMVKWGVMVLQALFNLDFSSALSACPPPPLSPSTSVGDNTRLALPRFTREQLGSIVQECVRACDRSGTSGCGGDGHRDRGAFVEKLVMWTIQSRELGWISNEDVDAECSLKALWELMGADASESLSKSTGTQREASLPAFPPTSSSSHVMTSSPPSQLVAFDACLLAAEGDVPSVVSAAEAMCCRSPST
jgi:hypothetical protein